MDATLGFFTEAGEVICEPCVAAREVAVGWWTARTRRQVAHLRWLVRRKARRRQAWSRAGISVVWLAVAASMFCLLRTMPAMIAYETAADWQWLPEPRPQLGPMRARACGEGDPRVDAEIDGYRHGKPPHRTANVNLAIRNPLPDPVWLIFDACYTCAFPAVVTDIEVSGAGESTPSLFWWFSGSTFLHTLRVPAGADLRIRGVSVDASTNRAPPVFIFADEIRVGRFPAARIMGFDAPPRLLGVFELPATYAQLFEVASRKLDSAMLIPLVVEPRCQELAPRPVDPNVWKPG